MIFVRNVIDPPKPKAKAKSKPEAPDGDNNAKDAGK